MNFREYVSITEDFDLTKAVKSALTWLENKYGNDSFTFKHIEGMVLQGAQTKSYDITVGDDVYQLDLRKFDSNGDGKGDTIGFDVKPVAHDKEDNEPQEL